MNNEKHNQVFNILESAECILLTTHENPDGDALASVCMLYDLLVGMGKEVYIFCKDSPESGFHFLPHIKQVRTDTSGIPFDRLDAVAVLDCATGARTGLTTELAQMSCPVLNIDHHHSNTNFGTLNAVDGVAVSTTQILYELCLAAGYAVSKHMATCILTGILTDSGNFAYAATNAQTFATASNLLRRGANVRDIITYTNKNKRLPTLKIWGLALSRLQYNHIYDIAYTTLTQDDLLEFGVTKEDLEGLSNFLNTLKDAKIVMVLYELADGRVKGSFRTTRDDVDVSRLAQLLGGGGHTKAAGFEVAGRLVLFNNSWRVE